MMVRTDMPKVHPHRQAKGIRTDKRSASALYRALLRLYPAGFRTEYGGEMCDDFARRRRLAAGPFGVAALWAGAVPDVVLNAASLHWEILRQDLRYTWRTLARTPGFAFTAIVVTALGIGANTAVFSITDHVLIRPLPFADPDRLVKVWGSVAGYTRTELSPANYRDWGQLSRSFESMAAFNMRSANLIAGPEPRRLEDVRVTAALFPMLGVQPIVGRVFSADDDREGARATVVLSHALWQEEFGGDESVLGRSVRLDDENYVVIGVMPPDFVFPRRRTQIWTPFRMGGAMFTDRDDNFLQVIGKLQRTVPLEQARAEMQVIAERLERAYPKENLRLRANVIPLRDEVSRQSRMLLAALFGASICVLLIACTNLASLLLARALGRRRELTVRTAMGAGRERLVRQLLTESLVLSSAGGLAGVLVAAAAVPLLSRLVPSNLPIGEASIVDLRVFAFAALVTCGTGIAFGIVPALRICGATDLGSLREGSRSAAGMGGERLRAGLVVAEVTASVALLVASGLLIRALWRVQAVDPGFRPDNVIAVHTPLPMTRYSETARRVTLYSRVLSDARALPGVTHAAYISFLPMAMRGGIWKVVVDGAPPGAEGPDRGAAVSVRFVTPEFFGALGIPLRRGRDVRESDDGKAPPVAVVSESLTRRYWPHEDPIGRRFRVASREPVVVGVVGDIRVRGLESASEPQVYLPYRQVSDGAVPYYAPKELVIRTSTDPASLVPAIRRIVRNADPELPVADVRTLRQIVEDETGPRRTQVRVLAVFTALALVLAGLGIHGLLAFAVSQRTAEIGVRLALGASRGNILVMVVRRALVLALVGGVIGVAAAYAAGRTMQALLAGITPGDPATFAAALALAVVMTLSGSLLPALRAVRVDPARAIRAE